MKKMVFCIIPLVVVLMGCATTQASDAPAAPTTDAVARALGDMAQVNGDTITLTDKAWLKTAFTVPEGVTLDLTQEGAALELQDGAVLTVNGTVNATGHGDHGTGWIEGSLRMGDGQAVIAGKGTINLKSKGHLLNIGSDRGKRQLTLDGVTLVGLPDNDNSLIGIGENSEFVLKSGAVTGNTYLSDKHSSGGGVAVWRGTFTMEGGVISGNSAQGKEGSSGGGVNIGEGSVFTMTGGEITGNSVIGKAEGASGYGGGVRVERGTFTMEGGVISGNSAEGGRNGTGGGVEVNGGTFTLDGGTISGNSISGRGAIGGGVRMSGGTFTMISGAIFGNSATGKNWSHGGGVCADKGSTFIMQGGTISANTAAPGGDGGGGGVTVKNGSAFIMEGGTIYGKAGNLPTGTDASLANSAQEGASLHMWADSTAKWGKGGTYKGGVSETGGGDIVRPAPNRFVNTDDTLIAAP
jgi:hypothetical protein